MNFTSLDGIIVHAFASLSDDKTFPGNAYHSSNTRITHTWMDKELAEIETDPDAVNFISKFRGSKYVVICDAGFIRPQLELTALCTLQGLVWIAYDDFRLCNHLAFNIWGDNFSKKTIFRAKIIKITWIWPKFEIFNFSQLFQFDST